MIRFEYDAYVELDLSYAYIGNASVEVNGNDTYWYGEVSEESYAINVEISALDLVSQLTEDEQNELRDQLNGDVDADSYSAIYARMNPATRAIMFNKLLKEGDYNAKAVSLERISVLLRAIHEAGRGPVDILPEA